MLIKYCTIFIISLVITQILSLVNQNLEHANWLKEVLRYVTNDSKGKQVILITNDDQRFQNLKIDTIIREFKRNSLSISLGLEETIKWRNGTLISHPSLTNPRSTSIFVMFFDSTNFRYESHLSGPIEFLKQLPELNTRPKLLIVHLPRKGNFAYRKLFRNLWTNQFLDVTVLQIIDRKVPQRGANSKILKNNQETPVVYNFNPLTGIYDTKVFSSRYQLFPDKLRDFYGHSMSIGFISDPPFSEILKNPSRYPIDIVDLSSDPSFNRILQNSSKYSTEIIGPNVNMIMALLEKFNFKVKLDLDDIGSLGCTKKEYSGLLRKIAYNEIQFLTNYAEYFRFPCSNFLFSRFLDTESFVVVVPVMTAEDTLTASLPQKAFQTLAATVIAINVTWALLIFLKFDNRVWNPLSIFQTILGLTIENEPRKLAERILFCSILITQTIFSGYLYSLITHVNLTEKSELEINNIHDLKKSGLTPLMTPILVQLIRNSTFGYAEYFLKKSVMLPRNLTEINYLKMLAKYRNVTCVVRRSLAELFVKKASQSQNLPSMKILPVPLWYTWRLFIFESGSPYVERFDQLFLDFIEKGLFNKWNGNMSLQQEDMEELWLQKERESSKMSIKIFIIPAIGYLLACVVFILEVLFDLFRRKRKSEQKREYINNLYFYLKVLVEHIEKTV